MSLFNEIRDQISEKSSEIDRWIESACAGVLVPLYSSVDLRVSDYKLVPVDTNIFPAGFNNLSEDCRAHAAELFKRYFEKNHPAAEKILIIPELHTRNPFYWENIAVIRQILRSVGFEIGIGLVGEEIGQTKLEFQALGDKTVSAFKLRKTGSKVYTDELEPDVILINNDFSSNCPEILTDVAQPVEPPVEIGWHTRRKDTHFEFYNYQIRELCDIVGLDSWRFTISTELVSDVNFDDAEDRDRVALAVDKMIEDLKASYDSCGIKDEPYVMVKSNSGTYGMAVISVSSGDELRSLNADGRKRMRVTKGGVSVRDVVVQEGVPTTVRTPDGIVAEPVAYLIEANVAGAFLRLNTNRSPRENLNSRGMGFTPIECINNTEGMKYFPFASQIITRVASMAAGFEIDRILREQHWQEKVS